MFTAMCTYVGINHPALPKNINNHHDDVLSLQMLGLTLASSFVLSSSEASSYMGQGENNTPGAVVKRKRKMGVLTLFRELVWKEV